MALYFLIGFVSGYIASLVFMLISFGAVLSYVADVKRIAKE